VSNLTPFQPFSSAVEKIYSRHYEKFKNRTMPLIVIEKIHPDFIFPITEADIQSALARVPVEFVEGIQAILVPGGSRKQTRVIYSDLAQRGEYWRQCIFLHPFPRCFITMTFRGMPNPRVVHLYRRVGATVMHQGAHVTFNFDEAAIRNLYLRDTLMHEIGHHAEASAGGKSRKEREAFADWFASEYRFQLWRWD
jgi:hypothetical protein